MPTISGKLDQFPFVEFVQTLASLRRTGRLSLRRDEQSGLLMLREGRIVAARVSSLHETLDSLLVERGLVTTGQVSAARERLRTSPGRESLGTALLDMGVVSKDSLRDVFRQQTQRVVSELMRWEEGRFEFEPLDSDANGTSGTDLLEVLMPEGVSVERAVRQEELLLDPPENGEKGAASVEKGAAKAPAGPAFELQPEDFRALLDTDPEPILVLDAASRIVYANPAFCRVVGKPKQDLLGEEIGDNVHPGDVSHLREIVLDVSLGGVPGGHTVQFREPDGGWRKCYLLPNAFGSQAEERYVMLRALTAGEVYARFDLLTGLLDYDALTERVGRLLRRVRQDDERPFAVLLLGINQFTLINVNHGWAAGNEALRMVADRLAQNLRPGDLMARATGDKFCVVLDRLRDASDADLVARRIERFLAKPLVVGGEELSLSVSIGVATSEAGHEKAEEMLEAAWTSMVDAKALTEPNEERPEPEPSVQPPRRKPNRSVAVAASVVVAGLLVALAALLWPRADTSLTAMPEPREPILSPRVEAEPVRAPEAESAATEGVDREEPPAEEPVPATIELELLATEEVWVQVSIDGVTVLDTVLSAGQSRELSGRGRAEVVIGNAGGLAVVWNGSDLGSLGRSGQVRRLYFTPTEVARGRPPAL